MVKVVFVGPASTGKSQVVNQLVYQRFDSRDAKATLGFDFHFKNIDNRKLRICDTSGNDRYLKLRLVHCQEADVVVYFVDLSRPNIDEDQIDAQLKEIRSYTGDAPVLLVGTKNDIALPATLKKFKQLKIKGVDCSLITSAKNCSGIDELLTSMVDFSKGMHAYNNKRSWKDACDELSKALKELPPNKSDAIKKELDNLKKSMCTSQSALAIEEFSKNCQVIIEGSHPNVLKAVLSLVTIALAIVVFGLIGFTFGFIAGAWTGPGAFIAGLMAGGTTAVGIAATSGISGLVIGGFISYRLFSRESREMAALNDFVKEAESINEDELKQLCFRKTK